MKITLNNLGEQQAAKSGLYQKTCGAGVRARAAILKRHHDTVPQPHRFVASSIPIPFAEVGSTDLGMVSVQ